MECQSLKFLMNCGFNLVRLGVIKLTIFCAHYSSVLVTNFFNTNLDAESVTILLLMCV